MLAGLGIETGNICAAPTRLHLHTSWFSMHPPTQRWWSMRAGWRQTCAATTSSTCPAAWTPTASASRWGCLLPPPKVEHQLHKHGVDYSRTCSGVAVDHRQDRVRAVLPASCWWCTASDSSSTHGCIPCCDRSEALCQSYHDARVVVASFAPVFTSHEGVSYVCCSGRRCARASAHSTSRR